MTADISITTEHQQGLAAYEAALNGAECWAITRGVRMRLPVDTWIRPAGRHDGPLLAAVLDRLGSGSVLDAGCGPGRLTVALAARASPMARIVGVDLSTAAVEIALARGAFATQADLLDPLPEHLPQHFDRVLLADGNIGIGGDPVTLLRRVRDLLAPGGRVVADLTPDCGLLRTRTRLEAFPAGGVPVSGTVDWAWVGEAAAASLGTAAGLRLLTVKRPESACPIAIWERAAAL